MPTCMDVIHHFKALEEFSSRKNMYLQKVVYSWKIRDVQMQCRVRLVKAKRALEDKSGP